MKLAARCIATMLVAFLMALALQADDAANPKTKNDEPGASLSAPAVPADAQPTASKTLTAASSAKRPSQSGSSAQRSGHESGANTPRIEWFLGYSFWRAMPTSPSNRMSYLHGGSTSVAYNFNRYLGLVADFGGYDDSRLTLFNPAGSETLDASGSAYTYAFGPRLSYRRFDRFTPFAQVLFGGTYATSVTISGCTGVTAVCTPLGSDNAFALMAGVGFDIRITRHIALRPFEGDFLLTDFKNPLSASGQTRGWQDNVRFSTGIVFRFGSVGAPPPPVAAACMTEPLEVFAGETVTAIATGSNFNPNRTIQYHWSGTGVTVAGASASTPIDTAGLSPGSYRKLEQWQQKWRGILHGYVHRKADTQTRNCVLVGPRNREGRRHLDDSLKRQ
jgi:opacity protein-like surface antigen